MTLAVAILLAALFLLGWQLAGIYRRSRALLRTLRDAVAMLRDAERDELAKEQLARHYGLKMLAGCARLAVLVSAVSAAPALALLLMDAAGLVEYRLVIAMMGQWWFIAATAAGAVGLWFIQRQRRRRRLR